MTSSGKLNLHIISVSEAEVLKVKMHLRMTSLNSCPWEAMHAAC